MPTPQIMIRAVVAIAAACTFHGSARAIQHCTGEMPINLNTGGLSFTGRPGHTAAHDDIDTIPQMRSLELERWLALSGLTEEETDTARPAIYIPPTLLIGTSAGANIALHSGLRPPDDLTGDVTAAGTTIDINPLVGLAGTWFFTPGREHMLVARVSYDDRSFTHLSPASDITVLEQNGETRTIPAQYQIIADYTLVTADILYAYRLGNSSLSMLAGPSVGFVLSEERLDAHVPVSGFASSYMIDAPTRPLRVGIKAGFQYTLRTERSLWLTPTILYDFGLTTVKDGDNWRSDALQIGIDFQFPIDDGYVIQED